MNDIEKPTSEAVDGSEKQLKPWEIAVLPVCTRNGKKINAMHATDQEFQDFVDRYRLPIDDDGITTWSFENRCGTINAALACGLLQIGANNSANNSQGSDSAELFGGTEQAGEADLQRMHGES